MPILNNPASGSLSRGEKWVPTHSGEQEKRPNGIVIAYHQVGTGPDWGAEYKNQTQERFQRGVNEPLENFVTRVRKDADMLQPLE